MKPLKETILSCLPSKLVERLMPFQKDGVEFAVNKNGRCLIADEMGLGKTLQAISVAYYYRQEWPLLIIVPSSLRYSWIEEFEKWLPDVNPGEINLIQSGSDASGIGTSRVTVTTFGLLSKSTSSILREALMNQGFQVVIVDESHYIRNVKTVSAKTVVPLIKNANRRILLSGTPALARPVELYPQIDAISPNGFGSWWGYTARYCDAKLEWFGKNKRRNVSGASNLEELQHKLSSTLMIRREKKDVLTQLPAKQRQRVLFELKDSELKKEIRTKFDELIPLLRKKTPREDVGALTGAGDQEVGDVSTLSHIQKLYQLSGEAKIGPAKEYVEMLCENPRLKFLVFAYHHAMMNGLSQSLYDKGVKFIRIDGDTPPAVRPQLVNQFQSDPDTRVAVLSILAAGVGLTFTAATVVVFAEMYWTPGVMVQCEDRAHRIGQTSCVAVHYLVAKDTMDEWVWSAVCKKTIVTSTTLSGRKQALDADAGDRYQIDVLSNADVWVPADNSDLDLVGYLNTQQGSDQKSILDYFSSSQNSETEAQQLPPAKLSSKPTLKAKRFGKSLLSELCEIDLEGEPEEQGTEKSKKETPLKNKTSSENMTSSERKTKATVTGKAMIIIDSGSDDDFTEKRVGKSLIKSSSKTSKTFAKSSNKWKRKDKRKSVPKSTSKCNLVSMFSKAKDVETVSRIELSDDDNDNDEEEMSNTKENSISSLNDSLETEDDFDTDDHKSCRKARLVPSKKRKVSNDEVVQDSPKASTSTACCVSSKRWNCSACTFLNHTDLQVCEICDTPKKKKPVSSSNTYKSSPRREKSGKGADFSNVETERQKEKSSAMSVVNEMKAINQLSSESDECVEMEIEDDGAAGFCEYDAEITTRDDDDSEVDVNDNNDAASSVEPESPLVEENWNIDQYESEDDCASKKHEFNEEAITDDDNGVIESSYFSKNQAGKCTNNESKKYSRREVVVENSLTKQREESETSNSHLVSPNQSAKKYRFKSVRRASCLTDSPTSVRSGSIGHDTGSDSGCSIECRKCVDRVGFVSESDPDTVLGNISESEPDIHCGPANVGNDKTCQNSAENTKSLDSCTLTRSRPESRDKHNKESQDEYKDKERPSELRGTNIQSSVDGSSTDKRVVNLDEVPVHSGFRFQCSKYTGRIYVLTQNDICLNINFLPMDVEVGNHDDLPDILLHPHNLRLVQRFVREWSSLTETKRRLIIRTCRVFASPLREYEELRSCKTINTQRHRTKQDTKAVATQKAAEVNGTVRVISKRPLEAQPGGEGDKGVTQVVTEDGTPLCLHCYKPYTNHLLQKASIQNEKNAWNTRFCSQKCSQEYWMVTNNDYCRDMVYQAERGVCQLCQFDAHALFRQVKDNKDHQRRAEIITKSKMNSLNVKTKEQMVKRPVAGQFWHVDHILPVWEGGGQCNIDNLRTLCVTCHHKVTARQASKRATVRKLGAAVHSGDITAFFQKIS